MATREITFSPLDSTSGLTGVAGYDYVNRTFYAVLTQRESGIWGEKRVLDTGRGYKAFLRAQDVVDRINQHMATAPVLSMLLDEFPSQPTYSGNSATLYSLAHVRGDAPSGAYTARHPMDWHRQLHVAPQLRYSEQAFDERGVRAVAAGDPQAPARDLVNTVFIQCAAANHGRYHFLPRDAADISIALDNNTIRDALAANLDDHSTGEFWFRVAPVLKGAARAQALFYTGAYAVWAGRHDRAEEALRVAIANSDHTAATELLATGPNQRTDLVRELMRHGRRTAADLGCEIGVAVPPNTHMHAFAVRFLEDSLGDGYRIRLQRRGQETEGVKPKHVLFAAVEAPDRQVSAFAMQYRRDRDPDNHQSRIWINYQPETTSTTVAHIPADVLNALTPTADPQKLAWRALAGAWIAEHAGGADLDSIGAASAAMPAANNYEPAPHPSPYEPNPSAVAQPITETAAGAPAL